MLLSLCASLAGPQTLQNTTMYFLCITSVVFGFLLLCRQGRTLLSPKFPKMTNKSHVLEMMPLKKNQSVTLLDSDVLETWA
jgi:hypothetical protein